MAERQPTDEEVKNWMERHPEVVKSNPHVLEESFKVKQREQDKGKK
jgi:uncharacterized protein YigA (DUF484 family)